MTTHEHFFRATKRAFNEFGASHRIGGLIVLFVVATFGAIQLMHSGSNTAAVDPAQQVSPGSDVPTPVEYFPAQYVNQATQAEKHIESF